ncbi:PREDICTED: yrdC domain-containing protein, mitochondrial isoform X1 [Populus euphratica]|uniref:Threonylcarbamoyl-AMP synthase n=1 Tax=Populus euphratica TaxID=75702 RepID=A0AAJ6TAX6_POPEU|nr:PREDICTED: yrdC domain-containing protein, mitochondrial isoform X1 [Populus euphratica]
MAETKLYGHKLTPSLSSLPSLTALRRHVAPFPSLVSFNTPKPPRLRVLSMAIKRSPKRLKYSAPRFTKEDGLLYVEADELGSDTWKLEPVIELLKQGAVGVIPTDTVYAIVCDLKSNSAIERLRRIKNIEPSKPLSILCHSLRDIDIYTTGFPRGDGQGHADIFRAVKHCLPGPYTFILTASKELPKQCVRYGTTTAKYASRKNVGIRMPDDAICQAILEKMDAPLISTSVRSPKENEWMIDPVVIADIYGPEGLDFVVNGGIRVADPSTVVDMTGSSPKVIRQGKGPKLHWMVAEDDDESAFPVEDLIPSAP